jgi:Replication stress response SDE2 C-terminal/SPRY domain/Silencing defective 2 N-terminal ubiquitin domain
MARQRAKRVWFMVWFFIDLPHQRGPIENQKQIKKRIIIIMQILARINNVQTVPINNVENELQLIEWATAVGMQVTHYQPPYCNLRTISRIRGGKGGFGTLLKGQSRLASANTTKDFSACRDLQGRRLRTVNDEINMSLWREWNAKIAAGTATIDDMAAAVVNTPSGIAGWHLAIPAWAEVNPKKEQRRVKELLEQWQRRRDDDTSAHKSHQLLKDAQVTSYMKQTDSATTTQMNLVKEALLAAAAAQQQKPAAAVATAASSPTTTTTSKRAKVDNNDDSTMDPPAAFLTISGSAALDYNTNSGRWRLQSDGNFSTIGIFLHDTTTTTQKMIYYYEIYLVSGGLCQVGWATRGFRPDSEQGYGVGDDERSWSYDGSRAIKLHQEASVPYGKVWHTNDVIGCWYDPEQAMISYSINGIDLGTAFCVPSSEDKDNINKSSSSRMLFPALSVNLGEIVELRLYEHEMDYRPDGASAVGHHLHQAANLDLLFDNNAVATDSTTTAKEAAKSEQPGSVPSPPADTSEEFVKSPPVPVSAVLPDIIDLDHYDSVEALAALGMDRLKAGLLAAGLKCGGTLQQRADRLFSIKGLTPDLYPKKHLLIEKKKQN